MSENLNAKFEGRMDEFQRRMNDQIYASGTMLAAFFDYAPRDCRLEVIPILRAEIYSILDWVKQYLSATIRPRSNDCVSYDSKWPGFTPLYRAQQALKRYGLSITNPPMQVEMEHQPYKPAKLSKFEYLWVKNAAKDLIALTDEGLSILNRLRWCPGCERCFFARRENQLSCVPSCRHRKDARRDFYKERAKWEAKVRYRKDQLPRATSEKARAKHKEHLEEAERQLALLRERHRRHPLVLTSR